MHIFKKGLQNSIITICDFKKINLNIKSILKEYKKNNLDLDLWEA